ncbi:MAG TPA: protein kinase [Solimonas sp.]|nr:protein kinase [Solimonas sp.]
MLEAGALLGNFRILRKLGAGGMADVYEAEDAKLGRKVALKVLPEEFIRKQNLVDRFNKEVRAAAQLDHPGIVKVFDVGEDRGLHFFSMQLCTGGDLRQRIDRGMDEVAALTALRQLAHAFVHAHGRGFIHRDVKPENVLFAEQGHAVLTDFGIAKFLGSQTRLTATGVSIGSPRYMSPEQARGRKVDARADLYSLGAMLFEMLTGSPPYDGEEALAIIFKHASEPIPRLPERLRGLQPLIDTLLAKEPDDRPESAQALLVLLDRLLPAVRSEQASFPGRPPKASQLAPAPPPTRVSTGPQPVAEPEPAPVPARPQEGAHWRAWAMPGVLLILAGTGWAFRDNLGRLVGAQADPAAAQAATVAAASPAATPAVALHSPRVATTAPGATPPAAGAAPAAVPPEPVSVTPPTAAGSIGLGPPPPAAVPEPKQHRQQAATASTPLARKPVASSATPAAPAVEPAAAKAPPATTLAPPSTPSAAPEPATPGPAQVASQPGNPPGTGVVAERYRKAVEAGGKVNADGTVSIRVRSGDNDFDLRIDQTGRVVESVPVIPIPRP